MEFNKNKKKIRDKSFFFVWMACLIFSLFFIAYFFFLRTSEVDVTKHIILQYSGENGSASLRVRSEEISVNQRLQDFYDSLRFTATPSEDLSNGDTVTITVEYDHELAQQYHLEPINVVRTITVEGLPDRYENAAAIPQELLSSLSAHADAYLELTDNSDRLITVYRLDAHGWVNRSDDEKNLEELSSTIYYMVVFPSINDSGMIADANAYGEKLLVSIDADASEEEREDALSSYLQRKGRNGYVVEQVNETTQDPTTEDPA